MPLILIKIKKNNLHFVSAHLIFANQNTALCLLYVWANHSMWMSTLMIIQVKHSQNDHFATIPHLIFTFFFNI